MADVSIDISAETSAALRSINDFSSKASKSLEQVKTSTSVVKDAMKALGAVWAASKIGDVFAQAIDEASGAEQAITQLNYALAASGEFSAEASKAVEDFGGFIQETTRFSQDAVIAQFALGKSLGLTNAQTKATIQAASQLATVTGVSLETAVMQLSQTYEGQTGRLAKLVPALRGMSEEQLRAGAAVDYVNKRFAGAAEAMSNTYAGAMDQMKNQLGEVLKEFGNLIVQNPVVVSGIKALASVFAQFANYLNENKDSMISFATAGVGVLISAFGLLMQAAGQVSLVMLNIQGILIKMISWVEELVSAFLDFDSVGRIIGMITKLVTQLSGTLIELLSLVTRIPGFGKAFGMAEGDVADLRLTLQQASRDVIQFGRDTEKAGGKNITNAMREARRAVLDVAGAANEMATSTAEGAMSAGAKISNFGQNLYQAGLAGKVAANNVSKDFKNAADQAKKFSEEVKSKALEIQKALENVGLTNVQLVDKKYLADLNTLQKAQAQGMFHDEKQYQELIKNLRIRYNKEVIEAQRKDYEELAKRIAAIAADPGGALIRGEINNRQDAIAAGLGGVNSALQGAQGATKLISNVGGSMADKLLPGSGEVVKQMLQVMSAGPDQAKAFVTEFVRSIPVIVTNIAKATPAIIQALVEEAPAFIEAIIAMVPDIIQALIAGMPMLIQKIIEALPRIAWALATTMINSLTNGMANAASAFINGILEGAGDFINRIGEGISDAISNIGGGGDSFMGIHYGQSHGGLGISVGGVKFAQGGQVPEGFPADTFPAKLTSGEYIIDRSTTARLQKFLEDTGASAGGSQAVHINLKVGEASLAKTLINLDRRGFRK